MAGITTKNSVTIFINKGIKIIDDISIRLIKTKIEQGVM